MSSSVDLIETFDRNVFYGLLAEQLEALEPEQAPAARRGRRPRMPAQFHPAYLLLEVISKVAGPEESSRVVEAALRAHRSCESNRSIARTLGFRLLAFKELRIEASLPTDGEVSDGAGWAVQILEGIRISLGDAAFASFIGCVSTTGAEMRADREPSPA
ncbi:hypothetical protein [Streptomyces goshikiensis]|uniref:hypothetical protein n=1 Tax=Streptomyces goshikiensis TaxID=1942 RepID=UPI0036592EAB